MTIHLGRTLLPASVRPTRTLPPESGLVPLARNMVSLFGLAPDGVYRAASVAGYAVSSYLTLSPFPHHFHGLEVCFLLHFPWGRPRRVLPGI